MSGVHIVQCSGGGVIPGHEESDELVALSDAEHGLVHFADELFEGRPARHECPEIGLEVGHEECCGHTLAGDIGYTEGNLAIGEFDNIVIIASHSEVGAVDTR